MNKKKYLLTFGSPDLKNSMKRFYNQSKSMNFYDDIFIYSTVNLKEEYRNKVLKIIKLKKDNFGYGYSYWKPLVIKQLLDTLNKNDILHYVDLGCHLNPNGLSRLEYYYQILNKSKNGILAFQYKILEKFKKNIDFEFPEIFEYKYTKADLLDYFGVLNDKKITHSTQYWAGNILLKKNDFVLEFLDSWIEVFEKRFDLVDHTKSKLPNFNKFEQNKSDQSVFSLLCKSKNIESISAFECEWFYHKGYRYWKHTENKPIIAKRDLKFNIFKRFFNRQKRTFRRFYSRIFK